MLCGLSFIGLIVAGTAMLLWMRARRAEDVRYHASLPRTVLVHSDAFANGEHIPEGYTCRGEAVSPPLAWSNLPPGTKSLALIVTDEDLPFAAFPFFHIVHWGLYNIPAASTHFAQELTGRKREKAGIGAVRNWSRGTEYYPPCPLYGDHRYAFRLYALDAESIGPGLRTRSDLLRAMRGRILAYGELNGRCRR